MDKKERYELLAKRIKEVREEKELTTEFVAHRAEISHDKYLAIENGSYNPDELEPIASVAFVLDISVDYLTGFSDEKKPSNQSELLNKYDISDEEQRMPREILHTFMLFNEGEQKELLEIIKEELNKNK